MCTALLGMNQQAEIKNLPYFFLPSQQNKFTTYALLSRLCQRKIYPLPERDQQAEIKDRNNFSLSNIVG